MKSRYEGKRFIDKVNFPHGFNRGTFSIPHATMLEEYGAHCVALMHAEIEPETEEERHFVAVCGRTNVPRSELEHVWLQYLKLVEDRQNLKSIFLGKGGGFTVAAEEGTETISFSTIIYREEWAKRHK
ncbi:MAG: DUF413 domain-containing protein [Pseudomonadota bacterium]|nr:DUF413 domain-containing protein [Pseudomonadota bacterium]